jgi:PAS domain S-box-containing protein
MKAFAFASSHAGKRMLRCSVKSACWRTGPDALGSEAAIATERNQFTDRGPNMITAPAPSNELDRLAALQSYDILDSSAEEAFDDLTALAAQICGTPMALISLVDGNREWFKSKVGVEALESPRDSAFCAHGILQDDVFVVPNALTDERFSDNPQVAGDAHVRFYAGAPLVTADGYTLGMLCVKDIVPRDLSPAQAEALRILGRQVMSQMELRRGVAALSQAVARQQQAEQERARSLALLQATLEAVADGILVVDVAGTIVSFNHQFVELWGIPETILATRDGRSVLSFVRDLIHEGGDFLDKVEALYTQPERSSYDLLELKDGRLVERYSQPQRIDDFTVGRVWGFRDVSDRKRAEQERVRLQEEIIQAQTAALAELSTPLIPLTDRVMVMPLIGTVDTRRAQDVLDTLLHGIAQTQAQVVILDITGVPLVDSQVANGLVRAAQAVQLLGARAVLTGIRPEVAQTLIGLGVDLTSIVTRGTVQSGIAFAMGQDG